MAVNRTQVVRVFNAQSITSGGTVTSDPFPIFGATRMALSYTINNATSGPYVAVTARCLFAAKSNGTFLQAVNSGAIVLGQFLTVNSINRYVSFFTPGDMPIAPYMQVRLISATNNTITFDNVWAVLDQQP